MSSKPLQNEPDPVRLGPGWTQKPRVGILSAPQLNQGANHLSATIIRALAARKDLEIVVINQGSTTDFRPIEGVSTTNIATTSRFPARILQGLLLPLDVWFPSGRFKPLHKLGLDLLVSTFSASPAGLYTGIPSICWIADIMHLYYPKLREFDFRTRMRRRTQYPSAARRSVLCVADSPCGKDQLVKHYNLRPERVRSIEYIPPPHIFEHAEMNLDDARALLKRHSLPEEFLFYPAQFWEHKNHLRLLEALRILRHKLGKETHLVLAGGEKNSLRAVRARINECGLQTLVHHIGYVSNLEMVALYKRAAALVFPSLFGPTNIPPVEAMKLGTPVLCSNLFSMPDQLGDAGLLFDPYDPSDMAEKIHKLWSDPTLRAECVRRGRVRAARYTPELCGEKWGLVIDEALELIRQRDLSITTGR